LKKNKLSVIIPVYYNSETLEMLHSRLTKVNEAIPEMNMEIVFVDDGSGDNSYDVIMKIAAKNQNVTAIRLSRNFGSFVACLAGLTKATGDSAVIISADLQDPPELISEMFLKWKEGSEVVMAVRSRREDNFIKVFFANMYYRIFRLLITKDMPKMGFDFVLIDRKIIEILIHMQEKNTTLMGLILWTGFRRSEIPYTRGERKFGKSKWTLAKKIDYFLDSIMAFSKFPIRVFSLMGLFLFLLSLLGTTYVILAKILGWVTMAGWSSLMAMMLMLFGIVFFALGMIGEYIWRNLEESRQRPLFIIDSEYQNPAPTRQKKP
jgi:polyisoprenyl-phosphate glycosyltransferase